MNRLENAARQALEALEHSHANEPIWKTPHRDAAAALREALAEQQAAYPVTLETVYETIIKWDEGGGKRSRRELARRIVALYAAPTQQPLTELSPEFTDTARAALLWVLWHHQGGSSPVGQPIRFALGMGAHDRLTDQQIREAKRWASLDPKPAHGITGSKT